MNVGDRITVTVGGIAHGGHCVARHDGRVIFLRYAIPGEEVVAEITEVTSKFARGNAIEFHHLVSMPAVVVVAISNISKFQHNVN